ncbi:hypothetical protein vseg_020039 [Gypsophila vaccaria]
MESYQPPHHGYPPPPPPPQQPPSMVSDPQYSHQNHHYHQQQQYQHYQPPPPQQQQQQHPPTPPSTGAWYPPPPPQNNQWGPPPPPPPPQPAYSAHAQTPFPPPPPPSYPNQDWGNGNWTHHSGWEYPAAHNNEEDWAAKAKAWASSRSTMDIQQPQSAVRQEESSPYANQYPQSVGSHYQDNQHVPTAGFSSYQGHAPPLHGPPGVHQQEPSSVSSYALESRDSFAVKDAAFGGDMNAGFSHHQGQTNSTVYGQEVPSSYSSIPGNELPADGRVMAVDHPHFAYGNHSMEPINQPLEFPSRYSHDIDHTTVSSYPDSSGPPRVAGSVGDVSSMHSWTVPAAPGVSYPPIGTAFPLALQYDPVGVPPLPGQQSPLFGGGPGFQPPVSTHAGLSGGTALNPAPAFSVDAYGVPLSSERPKKAAVPNWLREEIIKTKATIARSVPEHFTEGSRDIEDELADKPIGTGDQEDTKSMDSARSAEEDDDEDEEDVERTAAINQEIKRVLTEVLLKVTDELFDEIATKVLSEDDHTPPNVVADSGKQIPVPKVSPPPLPPVSGPKESVEVPVPAKVKEPEEHTSGETSSGSPVNLLGLSNYASDEEDEIQASSIPKLDSNGVHGASENGLKVEADERPIEVHAQYNMPASNSNDHTLNKDLGNNNDIPSKSRTGSTVSTHQEGNVIGDAAKSMDNDHKKLVNEPDIPVEKLRTSARDSSQERAGRKHERHDSKRSSSGKDNHKETESNRVRGAEKDKIYSQREERHKKKDNTEDGKRERERDKKLRSPRHGEKAKESDSGKPSHREGKDSKYERSRDKSRSSRDDGDNKRERTIEEKNDKSRHKSRDTDRHKRRRSSSVSSRSSKDDGDKKRERTKEEKNDKSRHKSRDTDRHKRRRSSSVSSRDKAIKENPILSNGSSDEVSEDARRRKHSKRRNLSPSPVRRRQRKVSRSPHSKHTQQRHSSYSSLDNSRDRRSRSPERRHRR